jgi:hypothetical protein
MKIIKKLAGLLIVIVVIGGVAAFFLMSNLDALVKEGVERTLSYVLEVDVRVGAAKVSLKEQQIELQDLSVANPAGFAGSTAFSFGTATVALDVLSFQQGNPHVRLISATDPMIAVEINKGEGVSVTSNIKTLIDSANRFSKGEGGDSSGSGDEAEHSDLKVVIDKVVFEDCKARVASNLVQQDIEFVIAKVEVVEIGTAEGGMPVSEAVGAVFKGLLKATMESGKVNLPIDPTQLLGEEGVGGAIEKAKENVGAKIGGAVKGLFKKSGE